MSYVVRRATGHWRLILVTDYCARPCQSVSRAHQGSLAHFKASASPLSRGPLRDVRRAAFGLTRVWVRNALTDAHARRACAAMKLLDSGARSDSCCWSSILLPDTCAVRRRSKDDSRDSDDATQVDSPSLLQASSFELRASSFELRASSFELQALSCALQPPAPTSYCPPSERGPASGRSD